MTLDQYKRTMKIIIHNELIDKAKTKKDGIYSHKGYLYAVKNGQFLFYADYSGCIMGVKGYFHYGMGEVEIYERRNTLKKLINETT